MDLKLIANINLKILYILILFLLTEIIAAKEYFSDKTMDMDEKFIQLEERINKKLERALDNPLLKEMGK